MATGLATRCSACSTVFRVVPDQLRVSEGWVRCGRCTHVFNALEGLVDLETGLPRRNAAPAIGVGGGLAPQVEEAPDDDFEFAQPAARPGGPPLPAMPAPASPAAPATRAGAADFSAGAALRTASRDDDDSTRPASTQAPDIDLDEPALRTPPQPHLKAKATGKTKTKTRRSPAAGTAPSFLRSAERAARWRRPQVRAALAAAAVLAALGLAAQVTHAYRDLLAASLPETRPWLEQACQPLGCSVGAARAIESLAVESSGLVRVEKSSLYRLQVALRNRAGIALAVPALDVTLTDTQGRLIARKVLLLADLGVTQATIAAGRELNVQATLQTVAAAAATGPGNGSLGDTAAPAIAGYTIDLFYP